MPGGDKTGPRSLGPMTGRAVGYCKGYSDIGAVNSAYGRGYGFGYGRNQSLGFRRGHRGRRAVPFADYTNGTPPSPVYWSTPSRQRLLETLECQAEYFKDALEDIKQRIEELTTKKTKE